MRVITRASAKITKATIEAAWRQRTADQRLIIRDKECRGLALIVNPTAMSWVFSYRPRGIDPRTKKRWPNRTVTFGTPEKHSPDDARDIAGQMKSSIKGGTDPATEKKKAAEAEQRKRSTLLGELANEYEKEFPRRPKMRGSGVPSAAYVAIEMTQVRLAIAAMNAEKKAAADLDDADVRKLLATSSGDGGNARARFGALSRFLDWCQEERHIAASPCALIPRTRRPKAHQPRAHFLTPPELAQLWKAAETLDEPVWRDLAHFLIAVPCRRSEAARLEWSHLDVAAAEWRQPGKMTKNRELHRLHLHSLALDVLKARRELLAETQAKGDPAKAARLLAAGQPRSGLVFPAPVSERPIDTFSDIKDALVEALKKQNGGGKPTRTEPAADWRWHDFRRSFATALGEAGFPEAVADAVLNHRQSATRGGVLGVYQRASRWPEQVRAMDLWGRLLAGALDGKRADDNVVPMAVTAG